MLTGFLLYSQGKKKRQHGTEAVKSHIVAAKTVASIVKTSRTGASRKTSRGKRLFVPRSTVSGDESVLEIEMSPTGGATALGREGVGEPRAPEPS